MYTPDGAEVRLAKVSRTAARMYLYHCRWRDHHTGYSRKGFEHARADLKLTRATAYRAHRELIDHDFISETSDGCVGLRGGSFECVDKAAAATRVWSRPRQITPETGSLKFETEGAPGLKNGTENLKLETPSLKFETEHIEERARGVSSTSSSNTSSTSPTHTHPQPARAREADGGVCVVDLTFEDYLGYAQSEPGFHTPKAWAMKHYPLRDADPLVGEWKRRREQVLECRAPDGPKLTPYHVAAQYVSSVSQVPGHDVAGYIAQMRDVSDETRERLLDAFVRKREPELRAHAPP